MFDKLYTNSLNLPKYERKQAIIKGMRPYFKDDETTVNYVALNLERKYRNLVARLIRLMRKVNLQDFNYFVTFTYSDAIHTEATFKKKLRNVLSLLSSRKGWKYIGVWERSPKKQRLNFHGIFHIHEGSLPGLMTDVNSFSFSERKRQITKQNDYFNTLFGRNDFRPIENKDNVGEAVAYILKYIEKSGEKIVYSRGLPQYFISDVLTTTSFIRSGRKIRNCYYLTTSLVGTKAATSERLAKKRSSKCAKATERKSECKIRYQNGKSA